jgi:aminopeptidase
MPDNRIANLARILVQYSTNVQSHDLVAILGQPVATPLIQEVYREALRAGSFPYVFARTTPYHLSGFDGLDYVLLSEGNDEQLGHVDMFVKRVMAEFDVFIFIEGRSNTKSLTTIDPSRMQLRTRAHADVVKTFSARSASGDLRWVYTLYPTQAYAQDGEMSLTEFEDYVYSTTYADVDDPVGEWNKYHDYHARLIDWLAGKKEVIIKGPNVDLKLSIKGRRFLNADGTKNMPSGEIFTSPVEDSASGWIHYTYPAVYRGREAQGVELYFEEGKVVKATADKGEDFLLSMLDTDDGARYLGEFAIGTNNKIQRFIRNILFDEKIGGTIHLAVGNGFSEIGAKNESAVHWDMICDMRQGGQITVDGELFYDSGEFKIE